MDNEEGRSIEINNPGAYPTCCIELSLDNLAVNTVLQSPHINDYEGGAASTVSFDCVPQVGALCDYECYQWYSYKVLITKRLTVHLVFLATST